ncbi:MAG: zinc ribbon domain-containing protein [Gammaproteobacteria bacterium]
MNCPKCGKAQENGNITCCNCGIVFEKYYLYHPPDVHETKDLNQHIQQKDRANDIHQQVDIGVILTIKQRLLFINSNENLLFVSGRGLVLLGIIILSFKLISSTIISNYVGEIFLHNINLPFHEAGHVIFRIFGSFVSSLGGSLGQLLMPAICCYSFLYKMQNPFAAAVCFWWLGENFLDLAPYVNDARAGNLPLLGGNFGHSSPYGFHDWEYLLTEIGLIRHDHTLANLSFFAGSLIMIFALIWGGILLYHQYKVALNQKRNIKIQ